MLDGRDVKQESAHHKVIECLLHDAFGLFEFRFTRPVVGSPFCAESGEESLECFIIVLAKMRYLPLVNLLLLELFFVLPETYRWLHLINV